MILLRACYYGSPSAVEFMVSHGAEVDLNCRTTWFTSGQTLKEVMFNEFSEDIYDEIDRAIYRGGKKMKMRKEIQNILTTITWEQKQEYDPFAAFQHSTQNNLVSLPEKIVQIISQYHL